MRCKGIPEHKDISGGLCVLSLLRLVYVALLVGILSRTLDSEGSYVESGTPMKLF